jgi:hypothetical protein
MYWYMQMGKIGEKKMGQPKLGQILGLPLFWLSNRYAG